MKIQNLFKRKPSPIKSIDNLNDRLQNKINRAVKDLVFLTLDIGTKYKVDAIKYSVNGDCHNVAFLYPKYFDMLKQRLETGDFCGN